jgi:hypothetical protein
MILICTRSAQANSFSYTQNIIYTELILQNCKMHLQASLPENDLKSCSISQNILKNSYKPLIELDSKIIDQIQNFKTKKSALFIPQKQESFSKELLVFLDLIHANNWPKTLEYLRHSDFYHPEIYKICQRNYVLFTNSPGKVALIKP